VRRSERRRVRRCWGVRWRNGGRVGGAQSWCARRRPGWCVRGHRSTGRWCTSRCGGLRGCRRLRRGRRRRCWAGPCCAVGLTDQNAGDGSVNQAPAGRQRGDDPQRDGAGGHGGQSDDGGEDAVARYRIAVRSVIVHRAQDLNDVLGSVEPEQRDAVGRYGQLDTVRIDVGGHGQRKRPPDANLRWSDGGEADEALGMDGSDSQAKAGQKARADEESPQSIRSHLSSEELTQVARAGPQSRGVACIVASADDAPGALCPESPLGQLRG
jgi:hypothetical protein